VNRLSEDSLEFENFLRAAQNFTDGCIAGLPEDQLNTLPQELRDALLAMEEGGSSQMKIQTSQKDQPRNQKSGSGRLRDGAHHSPTYLALHRAMLALYICRTIKLQLRSDQQLAQ
jgi:hypothetical protein